jgi:hypothetical protein
LGAVPDSSVENNDDPYHGIDYQIRDENGDLAVRPGVDPIIAPNVICFSDMAYGKSRLWGIGDPLYSQRLYYSGINDINDWSPLYYLSMNENENDELIALEAPMVQQTSMYTNDKQQVYLASSDFLYAFKHNRIYLLLANDTAVTDYDIIPLSADIGALNRFAVMQYQGVIYFMDMRHRIFELAGREPKNISLPIQDYIDSLFTEPNDTLIQAFSMTDRICFTHRNMRDVMAFDVLAKTWSVEKYDTAVYRQGSFVYDTLKNHSGFGGSSIWMYENGAGSNFLYSEFNGNIDTVVHSIFGFDARVAQDFDFEYQTPYFGDGTYMYSIRDIELTASGDSGQTAYAYLKDRDGNTLATGSVTFDGNRWGRYIITFPQVQDMWLSIDLAGRFNKINSLRFNVDKVGFAPIK